MTGSIRPTIHPVGTVRRESYPGGWSTWARLDPDPRPGTEWTCVWSTGPRRIGSTCDQATAEDFQPHGVIPGTPADDQPSGQELDRACQKAYEDGLIDASLNRFDDKLWIRFARVIRAVQAHLPGQRLMGLREASTMAKALVYAADNNPVVAVIDAPSERA